MSTIEEASRLIGWDPGFRIGDRVRVATTDPGYIGAGEEGTVATLYIDQPSTGYIQPEDLEPADIDEDEAIWLIDVALAPDDDGFDRSERYLPEMLELVKEVQP